MKDLTTEQIDYELCFPDSARVYKEILAALDPGVSKVIRSSLRLAFIDGIQQGLNLCQQINEKVTLGK